MGDIVRVASAGTLESSDVYVEIEPWEQGIEIQLESVVKAQLTVSDRGALECVLRARVETAVLRGRGES